MALITVVAAKGAPGVTTTAMALAATWPDDRLAVVAELDPSGGDLAARFWETDEPSLVTLAEAMRRSDWWALPPETQLQHCSHLLLGRITAVLAPLDSREARAPLEVIGEHAGWLSCPGFDVIADCGRLEASAVRGDWRSPTARLIEASDALLVVARPLRAELLHLGAWLPVLREWRRGRDIDVVFAGRGDGTRDDEIADAFGVSVLGTLPQDGDSAAVLAGQSQGGVFGWRGRGGVARLPLFCGARSLSQQLVRRLHSLELEELRRGSASSAGVEATR